MKDDSFYPIERKGEVPIDDVILSADPDFKTCRCLLCHCLIQQDSTGYRCENISCPNNKKHVADLSRIAYVRSPLKP